MEHISKEIDSIKARNQRVELEKAWETSVFRRFSIAFLTYICAAIFLLYMGFPDPFISALVPVGGFLLSTLSLGALKEIWIKYFR